MNSDLELFPRSDGPAESFWRDPNPPPEDPWGDGPNSLISMPVRTWDEAQKELFRARRELSQAQQWVEHWKARALKAEAKK